MFAEKSIKLQTIFWSFKTFDRCIHNILYTRICDAAVLIKKKKNILVLNQFHFVRNICVPSVA